MTPLGQSAATTTPKEVLSIMKQTFAPDAVKFGGCFGMLNLEDRIKPFDELDVGRMRWACEVLDETRRVSQVLGQGLELEFDRFKPYVDEEKKRVVMGRSAWRLALDMKDMVLHA